MEYTVLLFYQYTSLSDTAAVALWQEELCKRLGLVGRIIVSPEGINGTLCGTGEACQKYRKKTIKYPSFSSINFKKSTSSFICFDSLKVKTKEEIVILREGQNDVPFAKAMPHIEAEEMHTLLKDRETNATLQHQYIIFDTRNHYESRIGRFTGALCPKINSSRDFKSYFQNNASLFKDKKVIMYCTGGVRCERISVLCEKYTEAQEIRHLKNGIHAYCEKYPDGYFRGSNYVFDDRISIRINKDILTSCDLCNRSCNQYNNCLNAFCNKQYICCDVCFNSYANCCSESCITLTKEKRVPLRPPLKSRQSGC